jgi:hypothetical protein
LIAVGDGGSPRLRPAFFFGHHHGDALTGVVQSIDTSNNTAVVTLGEDHQSMHRDWDHNGSSDTSTQTVTLDLSNASIFDASAMQSHCHGPDGTDNSSSSSSPTTTTLSSVQPGDAVSALVAVNHDTARQDVTSGTAVPVSKLIDWGQQSSSPTDQPQSKTHARRFAKHA